MLLHALVLLICCVNQAYGVVLSNTTVNREGIVRYHYEGEATRFCSTILIIGVGTAMSVEDYEDLAIEVARGRPGLIVAMVDHAPENPFKLCAKRYANLVNALAANTADIIPICNKREQQGPSSDQPTKFFLGGHSASGMVAIEALDLVDFSPTGMIGLSPFRITDQMKPILVPTLLWGFSTTTCGVEVGQAADQAYELSSQDQGRVLYQLQNPSGQPSHCVFANYGCIPVCPCSDSVEYAWIRPAVAESIHRFLQAVDSSNFTRRSLELSLDRATKQKYLKLFVNEDAAPKPDSPSHDVAEQY